MLWYTCAFNHTDTHIIITIINDDWKSTSWLLWCLPSVFCMLWPLPSQSSATLTLHPESMSSFSDFTSKWDHHEISGFLYVAYSHFSPLPGVGSVYYNYIWNRYKGENVCRLRSKVRNLHRRSGRKHESWFLISHSGKEWDRSTSYQIYFHDALVNIQKNNDFKVHQNRGSKSQTSDGRARTGCH